MLAKQHRHPFLNKRNVSKVPLDMIHSDVWDQLRMQLGIVVGILLPSLKASRCRAVDRTEDIVLVRKKALGFWTEEMNSRD